MICVHVYYIVVQSGFFFFFFFFVVVVVDGPILQPSTLSPQSILTCMDIDIDRHIENHNIISISIHIHTQPNPERSTPHHNDINHHPKTSTTDKIDHLTPPKATKRTTKSTTPKTAAPIINLGLNIR